MNERMTQKMLPKEKWFSTVEKLNCLRLYNLTTPFLCTKKKTKQTKTKQKKHQKTKQETNFVVLKGTAMRSKLVVTILWPRNHAWVGRHLIMALLMAQLLFYSNPHIYIRGSLNKFPDFFRMGTFIDSTHMKLKSPSKSSPPTAMHLLYRSNNFWKAPWKSSCVSVSMTFVTASFICSIVS